jgi:ribosomal protein L16/L10AE
MAETKHNPSLYRSLHQLRKGNLHRALHVSPDAKIPAEKLEAARHSTNPHIKKMAEFAHTMSSWKH